MVNYLISFLLSFILAYIALPRFRDMLLSSNTVCENFKGELIPVSMGIVFIFIQTITLSILWMLFPLKNDFNLVYLSGFIFMGFLGLLDDLTGEKKIKGLKGHIRAFFKGTLTTGALKAFLGFFISLFVSYHISGDLLNLAINTLIIGLFTNFINLFDLRPGRAGKVFIFISIVFIIFSDNSENGLILTSLLGLLTPYMVLDLKGKGMMGDVGSNALGITLGMYMAMNFNMVVRTLTLFSLILIHLMAEKVSFSKIIDNNKFLRFLDHIGR